MEDRFLRSSVELRHRPSVGSTLSSAEMIKVRLAVGDVEVMPAPPLVSSIASTAARFQEALKSGNGNKTTVASSKKKQQKRTEY